MRSTVCFSALIMAISLTSVVTFRASARIDDKRSGSAQIPQKLVLSANGMQIEVTYPRNNSRRVQVLSRSNGKEVVLAVRSVEDYSDGGSFDIYLEVGGKLHIPADKSKQAQFVGPKGNKQEFSIKEKKPKKVQSGSAVAVDELFGSYVVGVSPDSKIKVIVGIPVRQTRHDDVIMNGGRVKQPSVIWAEDGLTPVSLEAVIDRDESGGSFIALKLANGDRLIVPQEEVAMKMPMQYVDASSREKMKLNPTYEYPNPLLGEESIAINFAKAGVHLHSACNLAFGNK